MQDKIGHHKRYNTGADYHFVAEYLVEFKEIFDRIQETDKESYNMNFYLSNDDVREKYIKLIYNLVKRLIDTDKVNDFTMEKLIEGLG